ncbi:glycosyltransferase family 2 protein [Chryseobacterium lacus]|uniref:Glycosyltransferase family 2 protein n=1 Tax=Chryseobacterium lacus TaxID=2058346 RepID=A0A368MWL2_9FLAO|nr:glycosyltransferase family 2 protein [Chryseobacterium lacus]RCU42637.1 glycosyltransferase family 2 protein [Chryseobacterium lacus]RST27193.1 glycosyltransferase family 2 protein [Chryseobacterium lacus]
MNKNRLAIAILNWNGKKWLEKFLPIVVQHSPEADTYIIDNASEDDSVTFVENNFPSVKVIQNSKNEGFAAGYNSGLKNIDAEIYCLLNSDVEVTQNWIPPMIALFDSDQSIAAAQPKILSYHNRNFFEYAGAGGGFIDNLGFPYCRGRIFNSIEEDKGQYDDETEIFWASGCSLFIRSKDFREQGGFDERFFAHQEEIDLCWRLKNSGKKIMYTGKSAVYHVGGGTLSNQNPEKTFLNFRNNLSMMLKNLPFPNLLWLLFFRLSLDGIAGIQFAFRHGFSHLWAVVRSHIGFYAQLPETWRRRQKHQIRKYYQEKWLVFKHFL